MSENSIDTMHGFDPNSWVKITAKEGVRASLDGISPPVLLERGEIYSVSPTLKRALLNSKRAKEPTKKEIKAAVVKLLGMDENNAAAEKDAQAGSQNAGDAQADDAATDGGNGQEGGESK